MTVPPDKSDQIFSSQPVKEGPTPQAPGSGFQGYMSEASKASAKGFTPAQGPGVSEALQAARAAQTAGPSFETLIAQVGTSQDSLANVRNQLNTKGLQFKRSQQHLLRNKLSDASTYLRAANSRLGAETPPMQPQTGARPIERFINYVTDGENQLTAAQQKIAEMQSKGGELRPADFLLIQVKMGQAQQEIEFSSTLLAKVIDSIKQTLNIQL
jgi:hypothetical protein